MHLINRCKITFWRNIFLLNILYGDNFQILIFTHWLAQIVILVQWFWISMHFPIGQIFAPGVLRGSIRQRTNNFGFNSMNNIFHANFHFFAYRTRPECVKQILILGEVLLQIVGSLSVQAIPLQIIPSSSQSLGIQWHQKFSKHWNKHIEIWILSLGASIDAAHDSNAKLYFKFIVEWIIMLLTTLNAAIRFAIGKWWNATLQKSIGKCLIASSWKLKK